MQTFLPYKNFIESAKCLDNKRLGKQRVEVLQILKALIDPSYGWQHHPAVKMWRGYEDALVEYGIAICEQWTSRGYKDTCKEKILCIGTVIVQWDDLKISKWLGNKDFHDSHKSNLLRKDKKYYSQFNWNVPDNLSYVWPI